MLDRITWLIERAAEVGIKLVRACDLLNEETRMASAGSSGVQQTTANGIILSNGKRNGNQY